MNRYISAAVAAAFICAVSAGCLSQKSKKSSDKNNSKPISPASIVFDWQEAYENKLNSFSANSDSRFDLRDLNGDGSPELIISPDPQPSTMCKVYTYIDGAVQDLAELGANGAFFFAPASSAVGYEYDGDGFVIGEYFTITEDQLESAVKFYNNSASAASGAAISYEINGESVALPDYDKALADYKNAQSLTVGRKYSFSPESLSYAVHSSESWGAVLSDKQKELFRTKISELAADYSDTAFYSPAFEICDLNGDDSPELVFSSGTDIDNSCRIFTLADDKLIEVLSGFGSAGEVNYDISQKVVFFTNADGELSFDCIGDSAPESFTPSENLITFGRKYIADDDGITAALL